MSERYKNRIREKRLMRDVRNAFRRLNKLAEKELNNQQKKLKGICYENIS